MKFGVYSIMSWTTKDDNEDGANFLLKLGEEAEQAGWDGFFLWDHLIFPWDIPIAEPYMVLASLAAKTKKITLGTQVTPIPRRRPQVLARQLTTLDHLSHGRIILGAGLGGTGHDYTKFGEEHDYRILAQKADEALQVITGLWSGKPFNFQGRHYRVNDARFLPTPVQKPRIPIWIGGTSRAALRRAAKYDGWATGGPCPSAKDPGMTLEQTSQRRHQIMKLRHAKTPLDIVYSLEIPEDRDKVKELVREAEKAGITWICEHIFGWRCSPEKALEIVRKGPPQA